MNCLSFDCASFDSESDFTDQDDGFFDLGTTFETVLEILSSRNDIDILPAL